MPGFHQYIEEKLGAEDAMSSGNEVLSRMLDRYIEETIFALAIKEKGMEVDPGQLEQLLARVRPQDPTFSPSEAFVEKLKHDLLRDRFIREEVGSDVEADEKEIEAYYKGHIELFRMPHRFRAREILFHDKANAEDARRRLVGKSVEQFAEMAKKLSESPTAAQGGEMGLRRTGQLPPEIEKAITALKPLEISPVVQTVYGYHLFMLEALLPEELLNLETVRENIRKDIIEDEMRERVETYVRERRGALGLTIYEKNLGFEYIETEER